MPEMDGFAAAAEIRAHPERYGSPAIVMVTAYGCEEAQRRVAEEELAGYLSKTGQRLDSARYAAECQRTGKARN